MAFGTPAGGGGDTAVVVAVTCHLHIALVAPGGAPGVLHQPVVLALLARAVTDRQHTVVELLRVALRLVNWNDSCDASIATDTGPTVASAFFSACSSPCGMSTKPRSVAPTAFGL
uniref:Uncharacterized protein n=1 Tax=Anopheles dirus TaxID=7168 RepID=A0A182N3W3_9DIPT